MIHKVCFILLILCTMAPFASIYACVDTTVRDAAFSEQRDIHRMSVIGEKGDPKTAEIFDIIRSWFEINGAGLNIELVNVDASDPDIAWEEYGIPSAPPSSPVVVLAGSRAGEERRFFIDYWVPFPGVEDMRVLMTSPAREALKREMLQKTAVLLYIPGTGRNAGSAREVIDSTAESWCAKDSLGVSVVRIDRADKNERILLSFTGVEKTEEDWVGVVFGWGKLMVPLEGAEITAARLNDKISSLTAECTCLMSASALGVDIPLVLDEEVDIPTLAFDGTVAADSGTADLSLTSIASYGDDSDSENTINGVNDKELGSGMLKPLMWILGSMICIVGIVTAMIVKPKNGKQK
jgi:hypothetical protein